MSNKSSTKNIIPQGFAKLIDQHVGTVFARQLLFADYLKTKQEPCIDLQKGTVDFDNEQTYTISLIGTQLETDHTWLWAWAEQNQDIFNDKNFSAPFPPALLNDVLESKMYGQDKDIDTLKYPKITLHLSATPLVPDELNGDHIACVVAGMSNTAYWRDTHDEGVIYYLIKNDIPEIAPPYTAPHILNTIEQVTSYFATDNKTMVESFLNQQGFTGEWAKIDLDADNEEDKMVQAPPPKGGWKNRLKEHLQEKYQIALDQGHRIGSTYTAYRGTEEIIATFDEEDTLTEIEAHGFEGEENYKEDADTENATDMDALLGQWGENVQHSYNIDDEFPPKI